jgi:uncharacterized phage protein gp47/JayE
MSVDLRALARELDDLVRAVPGVITLFAADPLLWRSAEQITAGDDALPLVAVRRSNESAEVTVSVGVSNENQAPETAAAVAAVVRDFVPWADAPVHVRVSRISNAIPLTRE